MTEAEDPRGNVVSLYGHPIAVEDDRAEVNRGIAIAWLEEMLAEMRAGILRDFVMVAGIDHGHYIMSDIRTICSPGAAEQAMLFLGGIDLLRDHVKEDYHNGPGGIAEDDE